MGQVTEMESKVNMKSRTSPNKKIRISHTSKKLKVGESFTLYLKNTDRFVHWKSSRRGLMKLKRVSKQKIRLTALRPGSTIMSLYTKGSKVYRCRITISQQSKKENWRAAVLYHPQNTYALVELLQEQGIVCDVLTSCPNPSDYDALVIPGGADVNPIRYGQEILPVTSFQEEMDLLDFAALDAFVRAGKPVIGICRGMQAINVYFGGTLCQDMEGHTANVNSLKNIKNSWLWKQYGDRMEAACFHHQAIERLGKNLIVDQRAFQSYGGWIEAIHHKALPIYGVQWHPEVVAYRPVFQFFAEVIQTQNL